MTSLLRHFERGRVMATIVVIVTTGSLLAVARMVFSHPAELAKEPGIVLVTTPRVTSSQPSVTTTQRLTAGGGASSTQHRSGGSAAGSWTSSDSSIQGHMPQAMGLDPPVAVDRSHRQPAPTAPVIPAGTVAPVVLRCTEVDDDDDDKKSARNSVKGPDDDNRDIDD